MLTCVGSMVSIRNIWYVLFFTPLDTKIEGGDDPRREKTGARKAHRRNKTGDV